MFYKENYSFELGTFTGASATLTHIKSKAIEQYDRFSAACNARRIDTKDTLAFKLEDLEYLWALNLETGIQTMAIYRSGIGVPVVVVDQKMPWCGEPHHQHMAEFVNHHMGKDPKNTRRVGAEFIISQLNLISIEFMEDNIRQLGRWDNTYAAHRALATIDAGTPA